MLLRCRFPISIQVPRETPKALQWKGPRPFPVHTAEPLAVEDGALRIEIAVLRPNAYVELTRLVCARTLGGPG